MMDYLVLTCRAGSRQALFEKELVLLQKKECIGEETKVLTVEDPFDECGSGAATLNALFVVTENLSARRNYSLVNSDVLRDQTILIMHSGREYIFGSGNSKSLLTIPSSENDLCISKDQSEPVTNMEHLLHFCQKLISSFPSPGVWICSTDMSFLYSQYITGGPVHPKGCMLFTVESQAEYATCHGTVLSDSQGTITDIGYCLEMDKVLKRFPSGTASVVSGIVFLSIPVAESMLAFHSISPLESCTYVGVDGGTEPLQISLFFDILVAMTTGVKKDDYVSGSCGKLYKERMNMRQRTAISRARLKIWDFLSPYRFQEIKLEKAVHLYWDDRLSAENHIHNMAMLHNTPSLSYIREGSDISFSREGIVNCVLGSGSLLTIGKDSLITDSKIFAKEIVIGKGCLLSGIICEVDCSFIVPDGTSLIRFVHNEKMSTTIALSTQDVLDRPLKQSGFLNFYKLSSQVQQGFLSAPLVKAKLFPVGMGANDWLMVLNGNTDPIKNVELMSISDLIYSTDLEAKLKFNWELRNESVRSRVVKSLRSNVDAYLIPYFKVACVDGRALDMLETLDSVTLEAQENCLMLRRGLSCIADLLGLMAGQVGRMRSGPGNNRTWDSAFELLRQNSWQEALKQLIKKRKNWLARKDTLVRAARHYERALQILVECAVESSKRQIALSEGQKCKSWVLAECPCRIDLQGGWTDTPPICFEIGGSVVNLAVKLDGQKPIGARARRIPQAKVVLIMKGTEVQILEIEKTSDILDYNQPTALGALLKAAIIFTGLVNVDQPLADQLKGCGGIELEAWSSLPHGSGLGTSSILAGAVIAVLWTVAGFSFDEKSLLHSILCVEQLMTTGGGWQDQVGGLIGGAKRGYSLSNLPLEVNFQKLNVPVKALDEHLLLVYTGKVRLAKNILQNVIRNWYAQEPEIKACFEELHTGSFSCSSALESGDLVALGREMNNYWALKKKLAPGSEPAIVTALMALLRPHVYGQLLVGAGGGGFMCLLTKLPNQIEAIKTLVKTISDVMTVHLVSIDIEGILISHT